MLDFDQYILIIIDIDDFQLTQISYIGTIRVDQLCVLKKFDYTYKSISKFYCDVCNLNFV